HAGPTSYMLRCVLVHAASAGEPPPSRGRSPARNQPTWASTDCDEPAGTAVISTPRVVRATIPARPGVSSPPAIPARASRTFEAFSGATSARTVEPAPLRHAPAAPAAIAAAFIGSRCGNIWAR